MAATVLSKFTYPKSDTATGVVNSSILTSELKAVTYSAGVAVQNAYEQGTSVIVELSGNATADDKTAVDAVIAAHQGENFQDPYQSTSANDDVWGAPEKTVSDSTWSEVFAFDSGALPAGRYQTLVSCEHKVDTLVSGDYSEVRVLVTPPSTGVEVEMSYDSNEYDRYDSFGTGILLDVTNGQHIIVRMEQRKNGAGAASSILRRARFVQFRNG